MTDYTLAGSVGNRGAGCGIQSHTKLYIAM
jgi:hypothetical protein